MSRPSISAIIEFLKGSSWSENVTGNFGNQIVDFADHAPPLLQPA